MGRLSSKITQQHFEHAGKRSRRKHRWPKATGEALRDSHSPPSYTRLPDFVVQRAMDGPGLTPFDLGVYGAIRYLRYHPQALGGKPLTHSVLAKVFRCSTSTIKRSVARLRKVDAIQTSRLGWTGLLRYHFPDGTEPIAFDPATGKLAALPTKWRRQAE